jgi:hypothetical protein
MVRVNSTKEYIKELFHGGCLLVIISADGYAGNIGESEYSSCKLVVYENGVKRGEREYKRDERGGTHFDLEKAADLAYEELELDTVIKEYPRGFILFGWREEENPAEKREEAYHWVEEKLKENEIKLSGGFLRTLLGLPFFP